MTKTTCRSCAANIIWMKTKSGKNICVDYKEEFKDEKVFDYSRMTSHFATCPYAKHYRKPKKKAEIFETKQ